MSGAPGLISCWPLLQREGRKLLDQHMELFGEDILRERKHFSIVFFLKKKKKKAHNKPQYIANDLKEPLFFVAFFFHQISLFGAFKCRQAEYSDKSRKTKPIRRKYLWQCLKDVLKGSLFSHA